MGNISTTTESSFDVLESYFKKYPDVPKETILKQHHAEPRSLVQRRRARRRRPARWSSRIDLFSYDLVPMSELKRDEHRRVPGALRSTKWAVRHAPGGDSDFVFALFTLPDRCRRWPARLDRWKGEWWRMSGFPKTPDYYFKSLPDGTPYHEIVAFGSFITIFRNCQYWGAKEECKFCDINENARQMKLSRDFTLTAPVKSVADVVASLRASRRATRKRSGAAHGFVLSGGTITKTLHGKSEVDFYEEYIRAIKETSRPSRESLSRSMRGRAKKCSATKPPAPTTSTSTWRCGTRRLFAWINPGKAERVGWDNWVRWMEDAVEVFGNGQGAAEFRLRRRNGAAARVSNR